ncbi:hypothetical protein LXA43DRAFT_1101727 [Ganoderma leucocontextum]|nr:hypothetical protein LXA43DRAFT_1101727 [Ganoderma leucocontextum]
MAITALHQLLIDTVAHEHDCVLQFDSERQVLRSWLWPKEHSGALVAPENLREHRTSHDFLGPCCFCPAFPGENTVGFVEAAMLDRGDGEFVAICPADNCGYLVFLGRIFQRGNMPTVTYLKRGDGTIKPPRVFHQSEDTDNVFERAHFQGSEVRFGIVDTALPAISPARRVLPRPVKYHELLRKLDSRVQPGVPENAMKLLFARCNKCNKVTTRRVFLYHAC